MYLYTYLYDCSEQTSSRLISNLAIGPILLEFKSKTIPLKKDLDLNIEEAIDKLSKIQKTNGGFGYWSNISETYSYITVHCKLYFLFKILKFFNFIFLFFNFILILFIILFNKF